MAEFVTFGLLGRGYGPEVDRCIMECQSIPIHKQRTKCVEACKFVLTAPYFSTSSTSYHIPGLDVDKELSPCDELLYKKLGAWWGKNPNSVAKKLYSQFFAICPGPVDGDKHRQYVNQWIDWKTGKGEEPVKPIYPLVPIPEQKPPIAGKIKTGVAAVVMILAAAGIYYGVKELRK